MMNGKVRDERRLAGSKHVLVPYDVTIVHHQILAVPDKGRTSLFSILRIRCAMEVQETIVHTLCHPMQKGFHEGHAIHNGIIMFQIVHSHIEATHRTPRGGQSVTRGAKHELIRRQQIKNVDPVSGNEMALNPTCHAPPVSRSGWGKRILNELAWLLGNSFRLA